MSKNMKGILGDQYGKVGPVVGRKFREENVYSAYQKNVFNPRTVAQETHRARFKEMSILAHNFACGAIFGFRTAAKGTNLSPRNLFQRTNWESVTASSPSRISIDYTSMLVSKGGLSNVSFGAADFDNPDTVSVPFKDNAAACQRTTGDKVVFYIYCPDARTGILSSPFDTSANRADISTPAEWNGMKVHVWGFVRNQGAADLELGIPAGECSDSEYIGSGTMG